MNTPAPDPRCQPRRAHALRGARHATALYPAQRPRLQWPEVRLRTGPVRACTVLVDGLAARACVLPVKAVLGRAVTTLEGLGTPQRPDPVQQAFIDEQAAQCGYCLNGMIMTAKALLADNPAPSEDEIREAPALQPVPLRHACRDRARGAARRIAAAQERSRSAAVNDTRLRTRQRPPRGRDQPPPAHSPPRMCCARPACAGRAGGRSWHACLARIRKPLRLRRARGRWSCAVTLRAWWPIRPSRPRKPPRRCAPAGSAARAGPCAGATADAGAARQRRRRIRAGADAPVAALPLAAGRHAAGLRYLHRDRRLARRHIARLAAQHPPGALRAELAALLDIDERQVTLLCWQSAHDGADTALLAHHAAADAALLAQAAQACVRRTLSAADAGLADATLDWRIDSAHSGAALHAYAATLGGTRAPAVPLALWLTRTAAPVADVAEFDEFAETIDSGNACAPSTALLPYRIPHIEIHAAGTDASAAGTRSADGRGDSPPTHAPGLRPGVAFRRDRRRRPVDPVSLRLDHLDDARGAALIREVAQRAGWSSEPPPVRATGGGGNARRGRGFAYAHAVEDEAAPSWSAWVAEVEIDGTTGELAVTRVTVGHDSEAAAPGPTSATSPPMEQLAAQTAQQLTAPPPAFDTWAASGAPWTPAASALQAPATAALLPPDRAPDIRMAGAPAPHAGGGCRGHAAGRRGSGQRHLRRHRRAPARTAVQRRPPALGAGGASCRQGAPPAAGLPPARQRRRACAPPCCRAHRSHRWRHPNRASTRGHAGARPAGGGRGRLRRSAIPLPAARRTPAGWRSKRRSARCTAPISPPMPRPASAPVVRRLRARHARRRAPRRPPPVSRLPLYGLRQDQRCRPAGAVRLPDVGRAGAGHRTPHRTRLPFQLRPLLAGWNLLFHRNAPFRPDAARSPLWNRGAYRRRAWAIAAPAIRRATRSARKKAAATTCRGQRRGLGSARPDRPVARTGAVDRGGLVHLPAGGCRPSWCRRRPDGAGGGGTRPVARI